MKYKEGLIPYQKHFMKLLSENDAYVDQFVDRYYTAGTILGYVSKEYDFDSKNKDSKMRWLRYISFFSNQPKMSHFEISLAQDIYTPYSRTNPPDIGDHPYGGYLRLNFGISHRGRSFLEHTTFSLGVVGPYSFAYETQNLIHQLTHNPIFYGWGTQLKNEFIFNIDYQIIKKFYLLNTRYISSDILPALDVALGNADTHFSIGGRWRIGYNLDSDFGVNKVNSSFNGGMPYNDRFSFYVFGGISGRYQARNIFIQGNSFGMPTGIDIEYLIYDGEIGAALLYKGFRIAYTFTHTSKTFASEPSEGHNFGSIELNIAF
ncbi:hypothetical protein BKH42_04070 [Helicobacter sp. 13S00482-2]|uniref:lipid A deacylase LpxR family protein n=1 Tax=Helicobacter sp. 13S00482-2 TaxID=1476200 RepID=UPI000BA62BFF|nr:lipid A deacylase LpxR family protein [Helicobacter sp. 13S00482-2]PAF53923.1 hypothetical protein BKH42_04070 [Helicobacter sp. 13S00482-2]